MLVTPLPIITDVNPVQLLKASLSIFVTLWGISMEVKEQSSKASRPMLVIPLPIIIDVNPVQPRKANSPMLVTG